MARCGKCGEPTYSYIPVCNDCAFGKKPPSVEEDYPIYNDDEELMEDYT